MKLPNWIKITLWLLLIAFFSWLLSQRYNSIINGTSNTTDIIIFLIWIALIAAFIFQEVDFFGVKLKRETDNLRSDFKEQILNLRSEIQNTINMRTDISSTINLGVPASESQLKSLEETAHPLIKQGLKKGGIDKETPIQNELEIPNDIQYLFAVRYRIEKELNNLANTTWVWMPDEKGLTPQPTMLANTLLERNVINPPLHNALREVLAICNRAIHGRTPNARSIEFVRNMAPDIIAALRFLSMEKPKEHSS